MPATTSPTLSVCIPNYNHAGYLGKALASATEQSFQPVEIILLDDASTDDSWQLIQQLAARNPLIRALRNEHNLGVIGALNHLLREARGDYVHFLAADDYLLPSFYERSMRLLTEFPQAGLCCCPQLKHIEQTGAVIRDHNPSDADWGRTARYFTREEVIAMPHAGYIHGNTVVMKRTAMLEAGGYLPELRWNSDWFVNLAVALRYGVCFQPEPLAVFRVKEGQFSAGFIRWDEHRSVIRNLLRQLKSPVHADLQAAFSDSGLMACFGQTDVLETILEFPDLHDDADTRRLAQQMLKRQRELHASRRQSAARNRALYSPEHLRPIVSALVERWRREDARIVIMGAGEHTANLFKWTDLMQARLVGLLDNQLQGERFWSFDIKAPADVSLLNPDVVLISSAAYQDEMYAQIRRHVGPEVEIVRLYAQPFAETPAVTHS